MQKYSSKDTSINVVNKIYKVMNFDGVKTILDYGGGKYDSNKEYMLQKGCEVYVYDKYNRDAKHNQEVVDKMRKDTPDCIVCSNVLNVIFEDEVITDILNDIKSFGSKRIIFAIYEGDKSGIGKETSKGWQRNTKAKDYLPIIEGYFNVVKCSNGIIECTV